eukprot:s1972_g8.t1
MEMTLKADVITYMRYGSFAASMTGNVIFAGRQIAQLAWQDLLFYFAIMAAWALGSVLFHQIETWSPRKGASRAAMLVALISTAIDVAYNLSGNHHRWWIVGLSPIFGVEEAFAFTHLQLPATGVSKHIYNLSKSYMLLSSPRRQGSPTPEDVCLSAMMLTGMISGAVLGERLASVFGVEVRWCFLPVAPLVAIAISVHECLHHAATVSDRNQLNGGGRSMDGMDTETDSA